MTKLSLENQPIFVPSKSMPFRAKLPFDVSNGWPFVLAYGFQIVAVFYLLLYILTVDTYGIDCMNECCLHLSILSNEFQSLDDDPPKVAENEMFHRLESKNRLRKCIEKHQQIIKWDQFYCRTQSRLRINTKMKYFLSGSNIDWQIG